MIKATIKNSVLRLLERVGAGGPANDRPGPGVGPYHLRADYQARPVPEYFHDFGPESAMPVYQPDVYTLVGVLASLGATPIVDVGCGKALKLRPIAERHAVVGIDFGANIEFCRAQHDSGDWRAHDLDSEMPLPLGDIDLSRAVIVCSDVIEHLAQPLRLLDKLRACADAGAVVLLSTPERELLHGRFHAGPPRNRVHLREWSIAELKSLLLAVGFDVPFMGLTANDSVKREMCTIMAVLTRNAARAQAT